MEMFTGAHYSDSAKYLFIVFAHGESMCLKAYSYWLLVEGAVIFEENRVFFLA